MVHANVEPGSNAQPCRRLICPSNNLMNQLQCLHQRMSQVRVQNAIDFHYKPTDGNPSHQMFDAQVQQGDLTILAKANIVNLQTSILILLIFGPSQLVLIHERQSSSFRVKQGLAGQENFRYICKHRIQGLTRPN